MNIDRSIEIDSVAVALLAIENELRLIQSKQAILNECVHCMGWEIIDMTRLLKIRIRKIKDKRKKAAIAAAKD